MTIFSLITTILTSVLAFNVATVDVAKIKPTEIELASREFSLANRYAVPSVNEVMKKNILLSLAYLDGSVTKKEDINWDEVTKNQTVTFTLNPGETFAYHDDVLPQYQDSLVLTTNTEFNASYGYLNDGYLYGDGVCHLASLINWAARDAELKVYVPKDHRSVGPINEVPDDYGVSIYLNKANGIGERNNLYITNNKAKAVTFNFTIEGDDLTVSVTEAV